MKKRIERMTPAQEAALPAFRERWRAVGLGTAPVDADVACAAVRELYRAAGAERPLAIVVLASPRACLLAPRLAPTVKQKRRRHSRSPAPESKLIGRLGGELAGQLRARLGGRLVGQLHDQLVDRLAAQLRDQLVDLMRVELRRQLGGELGQDNWFWGGQDAYWLAYYEYGERIGARYGRRTKAHFDAYRAYALACGWLYPGDSIAFVSDRPAEIHFDAQLRLHSATGMAVRFRDGFGVHAWHGLRVPARLIDDREKLTPDSIEAETNADLRRVALEIFGYDRYLAARPARVIAQDELHGQPRRLLETHVRGEPVRIIEVRNGSLGPDGTRAIFHLGAMPGQAPHDCLAASYGIAPAHYREALRT